MATGAQPRGCSSGAIPRSGVGGGLGAMRAKLHLLHLVLELDARKKNTAKQSVSEEGVAAAAFCLSRSSNPPSRPLGDQSGLRL